MMDPAVKPQDPVHNQDAIDVTLKKRSQFAG